MLRQDEMINENFICKVCLKSRAHKPQSDTHNSFPNNLLSVSQIEAKKNFLVNIEQIDLRERAEFEIVDESDDCKMTYSTLSIEDESSDFSNLVNSESTIENHQNEPFEESASYLNNHDELGSSQSSLSQSDLNLSAVNSDTNYTDDEHSESDDVYDRHKDDEFLLTVIA